MTMNNTQKLEQSFQARTINFSTGKRLYPDTNGFVCINHRLEIAEGRDSPLRTESFTKQELIELCKIMIERWTSLEEMVMRNKIITNERLEKMTELEKEDIGIYD